MAFDIYNLQFDQIVINMLPSRKRKPRNVAYITALLSPLQWLHTNIFTHYANGVTDGYRGSVTYPIGSVVYGDDNAVYYSNALQIGVDPVGNNSNTDPNAPWIRICDDFRGVRERYRYTGQKITLEFILNRFFHLTFEQPTVVSGTQPIRSEIYIDNNTLNNDVFVVANDEGYATPVQNLQNTMFVKNVYDFSSYAFTIFVPTSWYTGLGPGREQIVRAIADRYVIAGITYNVTPY